MSENLLTQTSELFKLNREEKRIVNKTIFEFNFYSYFRSLFLAFLYPNKYSKLISGSSNLNTALIFFITNLSLSIILLIAYKYYFLQNVTVFFQTISEMVLVLPFLILLMFILTLILYIGAVFLGGKGGFTDSLKVVSFSSAPVIFLFIPYLNLVGLVFWVYLLTMSFHQIHKYKLQTAVVNIVFPFIVLFILMTVVGLFNLHFIFESIYLFT